MAKKIAHSLRLLFIPCQENQYRPEFLGSKLLIFGLVILIIAKLLTITFFAYFPKTIFFTDLIAALTRTVLIEMTNQERQEVGVSSLKLDQKLEGAAYLKAQDMMEKDYFAHQSPTGREPWDWLKEVDYNYRYAGENLAIGFLDSEEVVKAWIESPSHRENILNPNFQEMGIAVLRGNFQGSDTTVVVQFFGSPLKEKTIPAKVAEQKEPKKAEPKTPLPSESEIISPEEKILPEEVKEELTEVSAIEGEKLLVAVPQIETKEITPAFYLFRFMAKDYPDFLQKIIFYFLLLIIIALILNIFIRIDVQDKSLIFKTFILIILLISLTIFDKELIIQLIPHNLLI